MRQKIPIIKDTWSWNEIYAVWKGENSKQDLAKVRCFLYKKSEKGEGLKTTEKPEGENFKYKKALFTWSVWAM